MLAAEQFLSFLAAAMLITLSPGPDNLMVLGVGISRGRAQGMAFGLGCATPEYPARAGKVRHRP